MMNPMAYQMPLDMKEAEKISRNWWILLVMGIISVVAGILIFAIQWTLVTLSYFVGALLIIRGLALSLTPSASGGSRGWNITLGILSILVGAGILVSPSVAVFTLVMLAFFFGIWLIISGIANIASAIANRTTVSYWWLALVSGLLSTVLGAIVLFRPILSLTVAILIVGIWAIVVGAVEITLSFEAKRLPEDVEIMEELAQGPPKAA